VIDGITDKAGTSRASTKSRKEKSVVGSRKGLNRSRSAREITGGRFHDIETTSVGGIAGELGKKTIRVEADGKWSTERKGTEVMIETRLEERANGRIKIANKLMIKEAIRQESTRENGVVDVATPSRDVGRKRHIGFLARLKG
jgi:hypothetical protein